MFCNIGNHFSSHLLRANMLYHTIGLVNVDRHEACSRIHVRFGQRAHRWSEEDDVSPGPLSHCMGTCMKQCRHEQVMTAITQMPIECIPSPIPRIWVVLEIADPGYTEVMVSAVKDCAHGIDLVILLFRSAFSEGLSCVNFNNNNPKSGRLVRHWTYAVQCVDVRTTKRQ